MMQYATFVAAACVFGIGLYGVLTHRDLVKVCVSLSVMESAVVMILVALAFRPAAAPPIVEPTTRAYVDALPHALSLTAIVIGAGLVATALALTVIAYRRYGTTDLTEILRRRR